MQRNTKHIFSAVSFLLRSLAICLAFFVSSEAYSSCGSPANTIEAENCLPGTPYTTWDLPNFDAGDPTIQGFATDISVNVGATVQFKVSTPATAWRLDIYRMGYYQGNGARLVTTVQPPVPQQTQPPCLTDSTTGLVDCGNWAVSATWAVPATAVSGIYFAKLIRTDTGGASHIVFIVRNDASHSDVLFQASDTSWQAYNDYSPNFYCDGCRAYKLSYNRPFRTRSVEPQTWLFNAEYPMAYWLEANGYDVTYFTDTDTDRNGALLVNHKIWMSNGHDEYWSGNQRANVEAARAAGVNLAFFSSNSLYWKTRWETSIDRSGSPYRTLVCYKETWANTMIDPTTPPTWTGTWRDPRYSPPKDGGRPENELMGTLTRIAGQYYGAMSVPQADGLMRFWRNTGISRLGVGQTYTLPAGTVGAEVMVDEDNGFRPPGLFHLSTTTVSDSNRTILLDYGSTTGLGTITHALTLYRHASGALVFSSGTYNWAWGLSTDHDLPHLGNQVDINMQQATVNLLADMRVQPRTLQPGLFAATATTDVTAPQSRINSPAAGSTLPVGVPVTITGMATDSGGGVVAGVEVSTNGGGAWHPASGRTNWTYTFTPTISGSAAILSRAVDDTGNLESPPTATLLTITGTSFWTIWPLASTPSGIVDAGADSSVELGVKFRPDSAGYITGIRFYKASTNTGTHTGSLWTSTGTLLATATFSNEIASGWQTVTFSNPVAITANTVYVASYHTSVGHYSIDKYYFAGNGIDSPPLHALGTTATDSNGVYGYGASTVFPSTSAQATNYWVDVLYATNAPPPATLSSISVSPSGQTMLTGTSLQMNATGTYSNLSTQNVSSQSTWVSSNASVATVSSGGLVTALSLGSTTIYATLNSITGSTGLTVQLGPLGIVTASLIDGIQNLPYSARVAAIGGTLPYAAWSLAAGALPAGLTLDPNSGTISGTPTVFGSFNVTVQASDSSTPKQVASKALTINIIAPANSMWGSGTVPGIVDSGADNAVELGAKFYSESNGYITGARFYKASTNTGTHVANLWTSTGTLLATATFTAETPSGWQQVSFPTPIAITANAIYVISYHANVGHYSFTSGYFIGKGADNRPLHFPADGVSGPNGMYAYGATSNFPRNGYNGSNYWVDAVYSATQPATTSLAIAMNSLPDGVTGLTYSAALAAAGGTLPYVWSLAYGALPTGLTLDPNSGAISGTPTVLGSFNVTVQASDSSTPRQIVSKVLSINIIAQANSMWESSTVPGIVDSGADNALELGAKFYSESNGYITGARFYKASTNTGTHVANLWTSTGTLLAIATFTAETPSGWQQVSFPAPIPITANAIYVISYHANVGHYSFTSGYFTGRSADNRPLHFLADGVSGGNGVYAYGATSVFPSTSYNATNYWVDVVYSPTVPPASPLAVTTNSLPDGIVSLAYSANLTGAGGRLPYVWSLSSGTLPAGLSLNSNGTISGSAVAPGTYNFTVQLTDGSGQTASGSMSIVVVTTSSTTIWPATTVPTIVDAGPDGALELGVRFRTDVNGHVAGVRFYKAPTNTGVHAASLWSSAGTLLASAAFTGESASGWQQVTFASPVAVTANTVYVVSYHTNVGHYSISSNYFSGVGVDNVPLHALADGVSGGNGVYSYGSSSTFPSSSYLGSNYWVDVLFTQP